MKKSTIPIKGYAKGGPIGKFKPCAGCKSAAACSKAGKCMAQGMKSGGMVKGKK